MTYVRFLCDICQMLNPRLPGKLWGQTRDKQSGPYVKARRTGADSQHRVQQEESMAYHDKKGGSMSAPYQGQQDKHLWAREYAMSNQQLNPCAFFLNLYINTGEITVARNKKQNMPMVEFFNFQLTRADEKEFMAWVDEKSAQFMQLVGDLVASNYRVGVSGDAENACVIVSLTCRDTDNPNQGYCFTSRAEDWEDAMWLMLYKHYVVASHEVWPVDDTGKNWG